MQHHSAPRSASIASPGAVWRLAFAAALGLFLAAEAAAASAEHLYVAYSSPAAIVRYPLANGIPQAPDWMYNARTLPTGLAIDAQGTLYAAQFAKIDVYAKSDRKPSSAIDIPQDEACSDGVGTYTNTIAMNSAGFLLASIDNFFSGIRATDVRSNVQLICRGIIAFAPGARGHAVPVNIFRLMGHGFTGSAFDRADNLYVTDSALERIYEFSHPVKQQQLVRTIAIPDISVFSGLTTDAADELYAFAPSASRDAIDVYTATQNGHTPPARRLLFPKSTIPWGSISVAGRFLYVSAYGAIEIYRADSRGPLAPVFTLPAFSNLTLAVGP